MSRKMPRETNRTSIRLLGLSLLFVGVSFGGCGVDEFGTIPVETDKPASSSSSGDAVSSSSGNTSSSSANSSSSSSSSTSSSSGGGGQGGGQGGQGGQGGSVGGQGGAGGGPTAALPRTCMEILQGDPNMMSGDYTVDTDAEGPQDPFLVNCKKMGAKAWTLVAVEKGNNVENLKFLGVEKGTPMDLINRENAILGKRFQGLYSAVRIEWDSTRFVEFDLNGTEIFEDSVNLAVPIKNVMTSESTLTSWIGGGAKFCRATSQSNNALPGDSSWAIKPVGDNNNDCGCNSGGWAGRGAFYGGTKPGCNQCQCWEGGFAGVKNNGEAKSETVSWQTRIYVL